MTEEKPEWTKCPQCGGFIPKTWNSHKKCGWGVEKSATVQKDLAVPKDTVVIQQVSDEIKIGKEISKLEKIIDALENDTKLYAQFHDDKPTFWNVIRQIYVAI